MAQGRVLQLRVIGPEWEPLWSYAEAQGMTPSQAARELLLTALATNAQDAVFLAAARSSRHEMLKIAYAAGARAMRAAWSEIQAKAITMGVPLEDLG